MSSSRTFVRRALPIAGAALVAVSTSRAQAPTYTTFESFTTGVSVDGQGGWSATNPSWDEEVIDDGTGNIAWRVSNFFSSGSFGDQPIAPASDLYAGESGSTHVLDAAAPVTNRFFASFDIWSVTGAPQPGLDITVSPDDGSGSRQSFLSIEDNGSGIDIDFFDSQGNHPVTNPNGGFTLTTIATGLSYAAKHNIAFDITFVDGNVVDMSGNVYGNDIVRIFIDGQLVHTGTTWELYYWTTTEGQTPPTVRAIDTLLFRLSTTWVGGVAGAGYFVDNVFVSTKCPLEFQGFETDIDGWDVFSSPVFYPTRVASGTGGITSASGAWHAIASATAGQVPAGNLGGYGGNCDCASSSCAAGPFPTHGYTTSVDVYLDMAGGWPTDHRFDLSSAINQPSGFHRRDFVFNAGFFDAADGTAPGAGSDRFIVSASNNSGQPPGNPPALPIHVTTSGWYTFEHRFYQAGGGVVACEMTMLDSSGTIVGQWTRSDPTDIANVTVGGNRYAWFPVNEFDDLAFDNVLRSTGGTGTLELSVADCQDDADPSPGYQIAVELRMLDLASFASGFQAFVDYDMGTFSYRGDLSTYTSTPFPLHIQSLLQADDGLIELDGSDMLGGSGTGDDALLATLIFDVTGGAACMPAGAVGFETGGRFPSELSFSGFPLTTALTNPGAFTLDDTPPTLDPCPANIVQAADADSAGGCGGAFVAFADPAATDNCDPSPVVTCTPPSGSFFPLGTTSVLCEAVDACGNVSSCTFDVEVTATNEIDVSVELVGVHAAVTRCIHFQTVDSCMVTTDQSLTFLDHDGDDVNENGIVDATEGGSNTPSTPVRAIDTITVDCGVYTELCAKDEQHTRWADTTTTVTATGPHYSAASVLSLQGGDTDNDGDVDINDTTLLIGQFGMAAASGGCPWDGTRDADFSNNGAIGSEDYSFLTANWLTTSSCACLMPLLGTPAAALSAWIPADDEASIRADLTGDGVVDVRDVEELERRHGLSGELSRKMRSGR